MKFQYKALVAALALSAASLSAQAAMDTATATGNGSFILSVWNADIGSATFDLGYNYNSFADLVSQGTFDMTTGNYASAWSFISASSSVPTYWAIFAGDNLGSSRTPGSRGYFTTANSLDGMSQINDFASVNTVNTKFDTYVSNNNNIGNHSSVANGASTSPLTALSGAGSANAYGTGKAGGLGPIANAELGNSLQMLQILTQGNATSANFMANATGNNYTFNLSSSGLLSVTAVPEADSYAMLLAGLGVIGLVARRRKA